MSSRIIDLSDRIARNGHASTPSPAPARHLYAWDVDVLCALSIREGVVPNRAQAALRVYVDPRVPFYSVAIYREGFDHPLILSDGYKPGEARERTAARDAILWFINQWLSAAYKAPA